MGEFKHVLNFMVLIHVLNTFYFQTELSEINKKTHVKWTIIHCMFYGVSSFFLIKIIYPRFEISYISILILSHFVIEIGKYRRINNSIKANFVKTIFLVDQIIHLTILVFISYLIIKSGNVYEINALIKDILDIIGISFQTITIVLLQLLLIHKPANTLIVSIIGAYKPINKKEKSNLRAGRMIGTLERIIMLFFLLIQQYSSIGLILTAKSVARFNKISEDQLFAEYYLLGTLLSTIVVLVVSII